jgi:hypothetical protein
MLKQIVAVGMVLGFASVAQAAPLVGEQTEMEKSGPRMGQYRSFGWQERERGSDSVRQLGGDGDSGSASGVGADSAGATGGGGSTGGDSGGEGGSCGPR